MKIVKIIAWVALIAFVIIQFFPTDKNERYTIPETDFMMFNKVPSKIENQLKVSCYDCHSNNTVYPWYSKVQPAAWFLEDHIKEVKEDEITFPFKNIAFVSDFKEDISNAFKNAEEIAKKCNAKIHLLNINTTSDFNSVENGLQPIKYFLTHFPKLENYQMHVYSETNIESGIEKFEDSIDVDLIVMYTHSRKGLSSIFSKSITESITNHSKKPVMTVHL